VTASSALAPAVTLPAAAGFLGLHGLKQRWLADTVRDGLRRGSAAWFGLYARAPGEERHATLAACVYHALGLTVVADLAARTAPGGYRALFESHPDQLPAILVFSDEPSGREAWRRYLWVGPPEPTLTAPYTKEERAGRMAGPWRRPWLFVPDLAELALIERRLDRYQLANGAARLVYAEDDDTPPTTVDTKLARFCGAVADMAEASLFPDRAPAGKGR
jgi:hypothetical protein